VNTTSDIISYISIFSVVIPLLFYFFRIKSLPKVGHIAGVVVIFYALSEVIFTTLVSKKISTAPASNIYFLLHFALLNWFYYELFIKKNHNGNYRILLITGIVLYVACFIITLFKLGFFQYHGLLRALGGMIIITYSAAFLYYLLTANIPLHLQASDGAFWFVGGIVFHLSVTIGIYITFQYVFTNAETDLLRDVWSIHNVCNVIKNMAFAAGFYHMGKNISESTQR
jgi:uncharacterized membrane protein YwzB